ncbi:pyridoxine/pyridoxamine 5'-phosphate oxidase [Thermobispora bispora]|uniref:Pyridoxine/pyridoxamine 5'-phosphate oxidase n=1 Tax=Thermobispora bispora (strain ATCC 19993 / DSM 43833 / CBS 139.67 / JCM 10125 / KCTC 9307 / NBRC 14880 / R51) TaxID=469371 RepID=D6Y4X3_THEBD|nr:pyridoxamine 5'-phosphate oxidase [Thermobispora bispora]ADG87248.1 pyridoxamine 5'-phosphate oxidase [Thermobispora bispora DSM 43833]MBO2475180.1 pyridoxamine 5'-phosphate oxidase [Actinomycetales bacterium]MDI9581819.1 pyridoxamine 5'-phosphate oxidase [Thermobispora sp.]QSI47201.1 pyridoxamine 5'-phosphate oxidase [Thermobispora bispora]
MDSASHLPGLRSAYDGEPLIESDMADDPLDQFTEWFADAVDARLPEPNAMVLATSSAGGRPSARLVLLKGYDERGFVFFTNYESRKGRDLAENPRACLLFPWHAIRRQVRIEGTVVRLPREESESYFHSRPYRSRIAAWASRQSAVLESRAVLEERFRRLAERWPENPPMPDFWGGFRVIPQEIEFWQGGADRMHDRIRYRRGRDAWIRERLAP